MYRGAKFIGVKQVRAIVKGLEKTINPGDVLTEVPEWEAKIKNYFEPVYDIEKEKKEKKKSKCEDVIKE